MWRTSRQELIERIQRFERGRWRGGLILGLLVAGVVLASMLGFAFLVFRPGEEPSVLRFVLWMVGRAVGIILIGILSHLHFRRQIRGLGLTCPQCASTWVGMAGQIVVATGRCGSCGTQVLEETGEPPRQAPPSTSPGIQRATDYRPE